MKPCGKKKAGIAKQAGRPPFSQLRKKATRPCRSLTHEPSGLRLRKDTFSQRPGTLLISIAPNIASSSPLMTTRPLIALRRSTRVVLTRLSSLLKRVISWRSTICKESSSPFSLRVKVVSPASSSCSASGMSPSSFSQSAETMDSGVSPAAPPPTRGCSAVMVSSSLIVSCVSKVMRAFWCSPKSPTPSCTGMPSTYLRTAPTPPSIVSSSGEK
mmetsp:Transcript_19779/g.50267  ORF Transcript_19779/g.50267 Transcript_19779/m.50267 type:complete len:214 (+) Transcript_19779:833-1474(+)